MKNLTFKMQREIYLKELREKIFSVLPQKASTDTAKKK